MTATVANPSIPASLDTAESIIGNSKINELKKTRVLFYAGDSIPDRDKYQSPAIEGFGGVWRKDIKTICHNGNIGILYKCKFTMMRTKMIDENKDMLNPADHKNWQTSYILENSKLGPNGWEDTQIGGTKETAYLLYKERYPGEEISFALERREPNGEGGIVEITALKDASYAEIREAQLFFFPNWREIEMGEAKLPVMMKDVESHIRSRIEVARELPSALANKYGSIGNDMLKSCGDYMQWAGTYLKFCEDAINEAKIQGRGYSYPARAELVQTIAGIERKDDLINKRQDATNSLVEEMRLERAEKHSLEQRRLELEERKLRLEEIKAGIRKPDEIDIVPIAHEDAILAATYEVNGVENAVFYCGASKANGEPCQREVEEGKKCFQHGE